MNFGHLVDYNMTSNFLEKSYSKYGGELVPDPFLEN